MARRLIVALMRDFYRPRSLGGLFAEVFPGDYFNIFYSPDRVHQLLRRTRLWLSEQQLPLTIDEDQGAYSLRVHGPFAFRIPAVARAKDNEEIQFEKVVHILGPNARFSAKEAREKLGLPKTTFNRLIHWAIEQGRVEVEGASTSTTYHLVARKSA